MDALIEDTAERIFSDRIDKAMLERAETTLPGTIGEFPAALWETVRDAGLHLVGSPDTGTDYGDLFGLLKVAGRHAVPLPLAEILLANAVTGDGEAGAITTIAAADNVAPWARAADRVLTIDGELAREFAVEPGANLAGEARDRVVVQNPVRIAAPDRLHERLALSRAALTAGALERILAYAVAYATERRQFGRPIAKFQAVQNSLAVLAGEVAAAVCACDGAVAAVESALPGPRQTDEIAVAKARCGEAAGIAAEIAHQVHGAMGFTHEHGLHHFTRRVWAWRDEYGRERQWQAELGQRIAANGADNLWDFIARGHGTA